MSGEPTVSVGRWAGGDVEIFLQTTREVLLPVIGKGIVLAGIEWDDDSISACHPPKEDEMFHIWVWASPAGKGSNGNDTIRNSTAWGLTLDGSHGGWNWWAPAGQGKEIVNPDNGKAIAELVGDNLYIFPPLWHERMKSGPAIYRHVLEAVVKLVQEKSLFVNSMLGLTREERQVLHTKQLVSLGLQNFKGQKAKEKEEAKRIVQEAESKVRSLQRSIMIEVRKAQAAERKLQSLKDKSTDWEKALEQKLEREFEIIRGLPEVKDVKVDGSVVTVSTRTLCVLDTRTNLYHELGEFRITLDTGSGQVFFENKTRRVNGCDSSMHAPHVFANNKACFGNIEGTIPQLLASFDLSSALILAVRFLQTADVNDGAGKYVDQWPLAKDQKAAKKGWLE